LGLPTDSQSSGVGETSFLHSSDYYNDISFETASK
jgi:hypothetical protein